MPASSGRRLYVGNLPEGVSRQDVEDVFGSVGDIVEVRMMTNYAFVEYHKLQDAERAYAELRGYDFNGSSLIVDYAKPPRSQWGSSSSHSSYYKTYSFDNYGGYDSSYGGHGRASDWSSYDARRDSGYSSSTYSSNKHGGYGGGSTMSYRVKVLGLPRGCSWQNLKDFARYWGTATVTFADVDRFDETSGFLEYGSRADADEAIRALDRRELDGQRVRVCDINDTPASVEREREYHSSRSSRSVRDDYDQRDRDEFGRRSREDDEGERGRRGYEYDEGAGREGRGRSRSPRGRREVEG